MALAFTGMWVTATLAMAQPAAPGQTLTCTKVDTNGYCVEAKAKDNKMTVIKTEGVRVGEEVSCVTSGNTTTCTKITTVK